MNRSTIFTTIMVLLVSAFSFGCGPVDGEDWGYESQQAAFAEAQDESTLLDQLEYALTASSVDGSQTPTTGDIRQREELAKWTSDRVEEEDDTDEIDDTFAQREIRRVDTLPEVEAHREAAEDVLNVDIELLDDELIEDDDTEE